MQITPIKNITYHQKNIPNKGFVEKSHDIKNETKKQNPYKTRNTSIGFVLGFLSAYLLLVLYQITHPRKM